MAYKLLNLNVWQGGNLLTELLEYIHRIQPDIMCLQEVYNSHNSDLEKKNRTLDILRQEFEGFNISFAPAFADLNSGQEVDQGNAILSKLPILNEKTVFFDVPYQVREEESPKTYPYTPRNLQVVTLDIDGYQVKVGNTQGIWGLDGGDNERRLKMSQVIVEEMSGGEHTILAGDFNLQPYTQTILNIEAKLKNIFRQQIDDGQLKSTFNMKRKDNPGYATAIVDMIFVGEGIDVLGFSCPKVDISDHLPQVMEFEMVKNSENE